MTNKRITSNNPMGLQSHCGRCRANSPGIHEGGIRCAKVKKEMIISEIRFCL